MTLRHRPHRVLYVPLDDRPYNLKAPRLLAQMVDYEMVTPPTELLGRFRTPGQPEETANWLRAHVQIGADCLLLSLDMLLYGGLWASRAAGTRTQLAQDRMGLLAELRRLAPDTAIYAFSTILRLGTVTSADEAALYYESLFSYSVYAGRAAQGTDPEAQERLAALERRIPRAVLGEYQAVRARNHEMNLRAIQEVVAGNIDFLVLAQDTAAVEGLHRQEQAALREAAAAGGVSDKVAIVPGADEVAMCLLARFIHTHMDKTVAVRVIPCEQEGLHRAAPGEDRTLGESLAAHLALVRAREVDGEGRPPDMVLAINTPPAYERTALEDPTVASAHRERARQLLHNATTAARGRALAVCDAAFANGADDIFVQELVAVTPELPRLLAFAGWNSASNSVGCALAHGCLRLIGLQDKGAFDLARLLGDMSPMRYLELLDSLIASEKAHIRFLVTRLAEDWLYQARIRPRLADHICSGLRSGVFDLSRSYQQAESLMRDQLTQALTDLWIDRFLGRTCVSLGSDLPDEVQSALVLAELEETRLSLPWRRLFEIDLELEFGVQLAAAKQEPSG